MRRFLTIAILLVACCSSVARAGIRDLAPADEYFGRMKMSVLGIRNALNGLERRVDTGDRNVPAMNGTLALVDDAIRDWRAKYPRDSWLPRFSRERAHLASLIRP